MAELSQHFLHSSYREKLIEHLFVGELLRHSWLHRNCRLEVARPEVDNNGYDLIAEEAGIVRHIQLKASHSGASASRQKVHIALASKPSGCVVWIQFDASTLKLGPFHYFGSPPGQPLPDLSSFSIARHVKGNAMGFKAERPAIRVIPKGHFRPLASICEVYEALFGCDSKSATEATKSEVRP